MTAPSGEPQLVISPLAEKNEADKAGKRSGPELARSLVRMHRAGLRARRQRDLLSEKLLLHIDGTGDFQWAEIYDGQKVVIPRLISDYRKTENVHRLIEDTAVAHHTTMPLRYLAEASSDRVAKSKAIVDTVWGNHLSHEQDFNGLFSDALYLAMPAGFCPVHRYWREDASLNYEPAGPVEAAGPGTLDCFLGNPFGTVFDSGAKRGVIHWASYERVLPAKMIRDKYSHIKGVDKLEGSPRLTSAASFQRIASAWRMGDIGIHGSGILDQRRDDRDDDEELMLLVCREILPGVDAQYPGGRIQLVAVPGAVDLRRGEGDGDNAVLLVEQDLPAGDFSFTNFYSHSRGEDVHGKPWVEDLDGLQVDLNIAKSKRWEAVVKMFDAPIVAPGGAIHEDMAELGGYNLLEIEPSLAAWRPRQMEFAQGVLAALDKEIEELRRAIYTGGGYQASSRGESPGSRTPYRAIVALQQADNSIHGPTNVRFQRSACDFLRGCWRQMKAYGDKPWLVSIVGDEYAHLVTPYIDNSQLSDRPPNYKLVNTFGSSPELRAQEVLDLMKTAGADGEPFLSTEEARRLYPNFLVTADATNPKAVQRRRAKTVAEAFVHLAAEFRKQSKMEEESIAHPWVQQAALQVAAVVEDQFPRMRDDDLMAHLAAYTEVTQDETADPIARLAAKIRQDSYYEWQAMQAGQMPQMAPAAAPGSGPRPTSIAPSAIAAEMQGAGGRTPAAVLG